LKKNSVDPNLELKEFMQRLVENNESGKPIEVMNEPKIVPIKSISTPKLPSIEHVNPTDSVLQLITNKSMTSRDIQVTLKRSREHTSRLMKKLFENGLVQRNTESKPYTYSITEKGKLKVEDVISN
jgi:Sugar-specific transcriptional regulator TrmB.